MCVRAFASPVHTPKGEWRWLGDGAVGVVGLEHAGGGIVVLACTVFFFFFVVSSFFLSFFAVSINNISRFLPAVLVCIFILLLLVGLC